MLTQPGVNHDGLGRLGVDAGKRFQILFASQFHFAEIIGIEISQQPRPDFSRMASQQVV